MARLLAALAHGAHGRLPGLFVFRRRTLRAGLLLCVLFLAADAAGNDPPGLEHAHLIPIAALFAYMLTAILKGTTPAAEEACWQSCRAVIGASYTLAGIAKLSQSGMGWINDYYLRLLALNEAAWSVGFLRAIRLWIADSPRLCLSASVYALIVELGGLALLSKRWRPYYTGALLLLHLEIFMGMNILWPDQLLLLMSLGLPWERIAGKKTA